MSIIRLVPARHLRGRAHLPLFARFFFALIAIAVPFASVWAEQAPLSLLDAVKAAESKAPNIDADLTPVLVRREFRVRG